MRFQTRDFNFSILAGILPAILLLQLLFDGPVAAAERAADPASEIRKIDNEIEKTNQRAESVLKDLNRLLDRIDTAQAGISSDRARGRPTAAAEKALETLRKSEAALRSEFDLLAQSATLSGNL